MSEYAERVVACLKEKGWDAVAGFDNSVAPGDRKTGIPPEQLGQYQSDEAACVKDLGFDQPRTPTQSQIEEMYALDVTARECIVGLGYDVGPMPSMQAYIETFGSAEGWDIVQQIPRFSNPDEYAEVWSACPPPLWFPTY